MKANTDASFLVVNIEVYFIKIFLEYTTLFAVGKQIITRNDYPCKKASYHTRKSKVL